MSYAIPAPRRPTSVTVLAIIGITLASLALLGGICGSIGLLMLRFAEGPAADAIRSIPLTGWNIFSLALGIAVSILLLAASIGSLNLQRWSRYGMLVFAAISVLHSLAQLMIDLGEPAPLPGSDPPPTLATEPAFIAITGVLRLIYPLCVLIFFSRPHVITAFDHSPE